MQKLKIVSDYIKILADTTDFKSITQMNDELVQWFKRFEKYGFGLKNDDLDVIEEILGGNNKELVINATNSSKNGWTALHYAAHKGSEELVELLLDNGANVSTDIRILTPIHLSAMQGNFGCFKLIADKSSKDLILSSDDYGVTALGSAVSRNYKIFTGRIKS